MVTGLIFYVIGLVAWNAYWDRRPATPPATPPESTAATPGNSGNWITGMWYSGTSSVARVLGLKPAQLGPLAPNLKLLATFPYPEDPLQAYAAIAPRDSDQSQVYATGALVLGEYTLDSVHKDYVTLDKQGKIFYLYKEPEQLTERQQERLAKHRAKKEQARATKQAMREQRAARRQERAKTRQAAEPLPGGQVYVPVVGGPDRIEDGRGKLLRLATDDEAGTPSPEAADAETAPESEPSP